MQSTLPSRRLGAALAALVLGLAACGGSAEDATSASSDTDVAAASEGVTVVATTSILGDVAREVVGDGGTVEVLMGPGVDPHAFQPSAAQAASLREADLVLAVGLDLEEGLLDALDSAEEDGVRVLELAPQLDPIEYEGSHDHGGDDHSDEEHSDEDEHADEDEHGDDHSDEEHADEDGHDDHGPLDPHVWFDPTRMATGVELLAAELEEVAPGGDWTERAEAYAAELLELDAELEAMVETIPADQRRLVTNHEAIGYLAARYDLEVVDTVLPGSSADAGPDAQGFAELIATLEREGVRAIFAENTASDRLAESLAGELGEEVQVVQLFTDALGEPGSGAETYVDLLRTDVELIVDALA